ncbi:LPD7 domain-containing protein (plasmid) [Sphaerotilaceae bacterium SBD11-9]
MAAEGQQQAMRASEGREAASEWATGVRAKEFETLVTRATLDRSPKTDSARVEAMAARANAYDSAYVEAKQPALDGLSREGDSYAVLNRRLEELRKRDVEPISQKTADAWARVDAEDFKRLQHQPQVEDAAVVMAANMRDSKAYRAELTRRAPEVAQYVERLDAANTEKVVAKEDRKIEEHRSYEREQAEKAKAWSPEAAAARAVEHAAALRDHKSATERQFMLEDIAVAARNNQAYRDALVKAAPEAAKAIEHLERQSGRTPEPKAAETRSQAAADKATTNSVGSDEIFTAENAQNKAAVPADIAQRYTKVGAKYYEDEKKGTIAFEDKGNKLETASSSEQRAQELVRIALARGWDEIKVDGNENFKRAAWVEAATRGMHVKGYTPSEQDKAEVAKRSGEHTVEQTASGFRGRENSHDADAIKRADAFMTKTQGQAIKDHPELAGAYAKLHVVDAMMDADSKADPRLANGDTRQAVHQLAKRRIGERIAAGEIPEQRVRSDFEAARQVEQQREATR